MWYIIYTLAYIITLVEPTLLPPSIKIVGENEMDLGSYDAKVHFGSLPKPYKLTIEDKKATTNAKHIVEHLRTFFPTGILSIPPLDPYKHNNFDPIIITKQDSPLLTGKIQIHELLLKGAKSFDLKSLKLRMKNNLRIDFDVNIPSLDGHVIFNADLRLGRILPLKLNGKVKFHIKQISVSGAVGAVETTNRETNIYQLDSLSAYFHADEVHVNLKGLGRGFVQDILRLLKIADVQHSAAIQSTTKLVNNYVAKTIIEEVNKVLKGFSVNQIKTILL